MENHLHDVLDQQKTFYKQKKNDFTLTDHFKMHKGKNTQSAAKLPEPRKGNNYKELKKSLEKIGYHQELPEFIKKKAYMKEESGKKEMLVKLDSIEEQAIIVNEDHGRIPGKKKDENQMM